MTLIKKDSIVPSVTVTKERKKATSFAFSTEGDIMYINYDVIAMDNLDTELYKISQNNLITIESDRFGEVLFADLLTAIIAAVENEL